MTTERRVEANWLDIIPAMPLHLYANPVPVVVFGEARTVTGVKKAIAVQGIHPDSDDPEVRVCCYPNSYSPETDVMVLPCDEVRIDLDDPQGVAYALTKVDRPIRWVSNWMNGKTTTADRIGIAEALSEATK